LVRIFSYLNLFDAGFRNAKERVAPTQRLALVDGPNLLFRRPKMRYYSHLKNRIGVLLKILREILKLALLVFEILKRLKDI